MRHVASAALATAILFCATGAFSETQDGGNAIQEIQAFCRTYDNTWTQKGAAAVGPLFARDAIFVSPNGAVVKGREAITKLFGDIYKEPATHKCIVETAQTEGDGTWAIGEVTITGKPSAHVRWGAFYLEHNGERKIQMLVTTSLAEQAPAANTVTK